MGHMKPRDRRLTAALFCTALNVVTIQTRATAQQGPADQAPSPVLLFGGATRWPSDAAMHRQFVERFHSAVGLGRARMVSPSLRVGDDMLLTLAVPIDEGAPPAPTRYRLERLELVGVARHATPVAFVIDSHTDRSRLERTRPLSGFEERALASLSAATEVVAENTSAGRNVFGAIRATDECTSCHATSKAGDILGAFSYRLARVDVAR